VEAPDEVLALRRQQVKNFFCLLMLSNGTPMFCAGDEFLNTQRGNNNPYNQNNETTWLDWSLLEKNQDIFQFCQRMITLRKARPNIAPGRFWREAVSWHGAAGPVDFDSRCLAYSLGDLYVMINAFWEPVRFHIQQPGPWDCVVDTSRQDLATRAVAGMNYEVAARSVVVLLSRFCPSTILCQP
jgi:glycogen operon protein